MLGFKNMGIAAFVVLAPPVFAANPVFITNPTDKPWKLVEVHRSMVITTQVKGEGPKMETVAWPLPEVAQIMAITKQYRGTPKAKEMVDAYKNSRKMVLVIPARGSVSLESAEENIDAAAKYPHSPLTKGAVLYRILPREQTGGTIKVALTWDPEGPKGIVKQDRAVPTLLTFITNSLDGHKTKPFVPWAGSTETAPTGETKAGPATP